MVGCLRRQPARVTGVCNATRIGQDRSNTQLGRGAYVGSMYLGGTDGSRPFTVVTPRGATQAVSDQVTRWLPGGTAPPTADHYTLTTDPAVALNGGGGSVVAGSGYELATTANYGFLHLPQMGGAPTGTPAIQNSGGYPTGWSATYPFIARSATATPSRAAST